MKVSIIIPVRNAANTIEATLRSIFDQTHRDFEVVVIDGASTDGTMAVVNKYSARIAVSISQPDSGTSEASNNGLNSATGEIFTLLNADDIFADNHVLQRAVDEFQKDPELDLLFSTVRVVDPEGLVADRVYKSNPTELKRWVSLHLPGGFFRRSSIERPMFKLNYHIANDYEFICRHVIRLQKKIKVISDVTVEMRLGGMSGDPKRDILHSWEKFKIRLEFFGLWPALPLAAVAFPVSILRRLNFRPFRWYRQLRARLNA